MSTRPLIAEGVRRIFAEGFRVADIAEPLASFDETTAAADVGRFMDGADFLTIFPSRSQAEEGVKVLEGLRNSLAHAQAIVSSDWDAIVRLSGELDRVLRVEVVLPPVGGDGAVWPAPIGTDRGGTR